MNRSRLPVVVVLIFSILVAGFTRQWASEERASGPGAVHATAGSAGLNRMNSFALALLLGGLRGPLVMFLWPSAEEQKHQRNLEDFDTKIEWIRLLQAEFDSVHLFQIWNKAYNISAQLANLSNKYRAILDALDYAKSVDTERPNDINIIETIGQLLYFDKLGTSTESPYYRAQIREQSQARQELVRITFPPEKRSQFVEIALSAGVSPRKIVFATDQKTGKIAVTLPKPATEMIQPKFSGEGIDYTTRPRVRINRDDPGWRRTELDPILDSSGNILPENLQARIPRPANLDPKSDWNDGSELQYLKDYQPFLYGVSTFALAYNYEKRAQVLQAVYHQRHAQLNEIIIDSRPGLALKNWSEEEWELGRRAELEAFGQPMPPRRLDLELPATPVLLDSPIKNRASFSEAVYSYKRTVLLTDDAVKEYLRHLTIYQTNLGLYLSHIDGLRAEHALVSGDLNYLLAIDDPANSAEHRKAAIENYREAVRLNELVAMQYYLPDELAQRIFPKGMTRAEIGKANLTPQQIDEIYLRILPFGSRLLGEDFSEFGRYVDRAVTRLKNLGQ